MGPTRNMSFNATPEDGLAEALNTALTFVVKLASLRTTCIGR